jgi:MOSC domain-containing protein
MATRIGVVRELWRYPVKSMGGHRLERCEVGALGIPGDRGWAIRDERAGEIRGAKKLPALLLCEARYREEPRGDRVPQADITLPDGARTATDAPDVHARLSALLGRPVTLCARRPPEDREHYRRGAPDHPDMMVELREIFGRTDDEPLPDLSVLPPELFEYTSPLGTYFDAAPIHLLTTASLATLGSPEQFDRRRFRPNVLVETDASVAGLPEAEWSGRTITVGGATFRGEFATMRCSMVTQPQPGVPKDPSVLRAIVRDAGQNLGVYASIASGGAVAVGDPVLLG